MRPAALLGGVAVGVDDAPGAERPRDRRAGVHRPQRVGDLVEPRPRALGLERLAADEAR